jgi:hypothetical protein
VVVAAVTGPKIKLGVEILTVLLGLLWVVPYQILQKLVIQIFALTPHTNLHHCFIYVRSFFGFNALWLVYYLLSFSYGSILFDLRALFHESN